MPIIKHGSIEESLWQHLQDEDAIPDNTQVTVSASRWMDSRASLLPLARAQQLGIRLNGDSPLESLADDLALFSLVVVCFPVLADGRGFSVARLIREAYHYEGELRAYGGFLPDQMAFMKRCGIDSFEFTSPRDLEAALNLFNEFTVTYQSGVDDPRPLYLRS